MEVRTLEGLIKVSEPTDVIILEIDGHEFEAYSVEIDEMLGALIIKGTSMEEEEDEGDVDSPGDDTVPNDDDACAIPEPVRANTTHTVQEA